MSIILRLGAVPNNDVGGFKDLSSEYCGVERGIGGGNRGLEEHYEPTSLSYPGCFGLPYQDHNYGAPPPPTPPPVPTEESPPLQKLPPQTVVPSDNVSYHTEVKDLGSIPALPCEEVPAAAAATEVYPVEDNSITRCICNFIHDDGYMICCDKCSVWQHIDCMGVNRNNIPDTYFCELCEPRPLDTERARQIQLKKKEFLDTLTDSSATDTDPEEASNRQMAQQQQQSMENNNLFQGLKKVKKKRRSKSGNNNSKVNNKVDGKQKKQKREKKDVKKEKENKELNKSQKASNTKDTVPVLKTRKSKLQASKKPGLSLIINENTQDPWDSSYSPWVDKYEEACENLYSADIQSLFTTSKINGVNTPDKIVPNGQLLVQLCHVTDVNKNRKGLEASETIGEGEIVIEYTGKVMLKHQFDKDNFFRYLNPFVLFYSKFENVELCIDATSFGNTARFIRRSCKANAEVRHVLKNGKIYFYVYSIKVIPRGSEITIPYDYNYKECTYCVECACLRNNCTVSKYFKRKLNANNKKDKSPMKTPKSPIKSPVKMKDKDKQASQSPVDSAESIPSVVNKVLSPKKEPQTSCTSSTSEQNTVSRVVTRAASLDQNLENCNSSLTTQSTESHSETDESVSAEKNQHKMTREERKMEAIMKAFEKLEKREERRKEALSRIDCRKSTETKKEEKEPQSEPTVPKKDVKKEKVKTKEKEKEKEKHTKSEETKASVVEEKAPEIDDVPVKEEKPVILPEEPEKITVDEKVEEEVKPEIPIEVPTVETVKEKPKPRVKRSKKVSNRRRSRANSGNVAVMEHSLSMEEESVSTPAQASCPSTPISAPVDVTTTSPSFKFLKTKKHLMNEWLSEKCQESFMSPEPLPDPGKMEPLEVKVEETIFVSCLPSPRNAMDHLRRNSQSSGSAVGKSNVAESSVGSAKKRWLRQAMWEKPRSDSGSISPVLASSGGASPSLPSPGASPPGDFVTPLKKRRMARESCDTPTGQCQSKVSPSVTPVSCTDIVMSSYDDNENIEAPSAIMEDEPSTKTSEEKSLGTVSKMGIPKKRNFLIQKDFQTPKVNDSSGETDSSVSQMTSSHDEYLGIEQDKTLNINITDTGSNESEFHSGLENMEDRTSYAAEGSSLVDEKECEVTNSVKDTRSIENDDQSCSIDQLSVDAECSSFRNDEEAVEISGGMNDNEEDITSETEEIITEGSECTRVDSTEDQISENPEQILERHNICDSTSRSDDLKVTGVTVESSQQLISASYVCNSENVEESSPCVGSSTDSRKLSEEHMDYSQTYRVEVDSACRENSQQLCNIQTEANLVDDSVCKNSGSEIVGSSSDENKETCLSGGVSSSSETRTSHTMTLEPQSTSMDNAGVTSSINLSENSNFVSESESADSSVCEVSIDNKVDSEQVTNETQNLSNSSFISKQEEISSAQSDLSVEHFMEATSSSTVEEESAVPQSAEVPTSFLSTVSEMPNLDVDSTSTTTPEHVPPPQKKKVSLLEYRQRLKEKGPTNKSTLSLSSLSSSHRSSSSSSSSSSTQSVHSHQSCLSSLPSLPLFDATSPTRDSSSVRHQFKSSSDLIRRKSVEKKREKPLSLTERLKQEFGFEDDEEEPAKEEKPPDPPPPQSTTHVPPPGVGQQGVTPHMTQMAHNIQGSIQTGCQLPVMMRGHASSMVSAQGSSIPPQHSGVVNPLHNVILPSQSSTPGQNSVPPSSLAGVNGSNHAPQTTSHFGPVTIPVSVGNGPDSSVTGPIAAGMLSQNQLGCNPHHQSPHSQQGFKSSQSTSQTGQQHMYPPPPASVGNGRQPAFHQQNQSHSYNQPQDGANFNLLPHAQSSSLCEQSHLQANGVVLLDYNHGYGSASKLPHDSVHHQQSQSGYSPESCHSHSQGSVQRKKPRKSKYKKDNCHSRNYSDYH